MSYEKDNPEKAKARALKRYYEKKEEILEKNKEYRKNNPEKMKEYHEKYKQDPENKKKINIRAKHYQNGFRDKIIEERGGCEVCGVKEKLHLHHEKYEGKQVKVLCQIHHSEYHRNLRGARMRWVDKLKIKLENKAEKLCSKCNVRVARSYGPLCNECYEVDPVLKEILGEKISK